MGSPGKHILIIVENLSVPFDKRVWNEANALTRAGYKVSIIGPVGKGAEKRREEIDGISIYRHPLPGEGNGAFGYFVEYSAALFWELALATRVYFTSGFDAIHACNPPDTIFLIGLVFKLLGNQFGMSKAVGIRYSPSDGFSILPLESNFTSSKSASPRPMESEPSI